MDAEKTLNPLANEQGNVERWTEAVEGLDKAKAVADFHGGVQLSIETRDLRTRYAARLDHAEARLARARRQLEMRQEADEIGGADA